MRQDGTYTAKGRSVATIRCRPRGDAHLKGKGWVAVAMTTKPHPPTHQEGGGWVVSERRHLCVVDGVGSWSPWTLAGYLFFPLKKKKDNCSRIFFVSLSLSLSYRLAAARYSEPVERCSAGRGIFFAAT